MEYVQGNNKIKIDRGVHYTKLKIFGWKQSDFQLVYDNPFLPVCDSKIEAEENAIRIADLYTE